MRTFAIVNQKGGCGKTTTAINLSAVFARRGLRTLLVDMDPQSHCAIGLGVPEQRIDLSVSDALLDVGADQIDPASLLWEVAGNLDLIPSTMRLAALEAPGGGLYELPDRDRRLARLLDRFAGQYDRCLIDCPPTIGLLTFNALRAAREALIPVETGFFALRGADKQWRTVRQLIERIGRPIACHLFPTLYDADSPLATDILAALRRQFAGQVIPVVVHEHEVVREAASFGQPVIEYAPQSKAREDFERLADWLEDHVPQPAVEIEVVKAQGQRAATAVRSRDRIAAAQGPSTRTPASPRPQDRAAELARRVRDLQHRSPQPPEGSQGDAEPKPEPRETPSPDAEHRKRQMDAAEATGPHPPAGEPSTHLAARVFGVHTTTRGVRFIQPGEERHSVHVAGEFNQWSASATPLHYDPHLRAHHALVEIPPGRYQYRLVIDGRWHADPYNAHEQLNDYGEPNSVLVVGQPQDPP